MSSDLGRINIFTLTQEAAKAAMRFIHSLPTNEDGDETIAAEIEHQLKSTIEEAVRTAYLNLIEDKLEDPEELRDFRLAFGQSAMWAYAAR